MSLNREICFCNKNSTVGEFTARIRKGMGSLRIDIYIQLFFLRITRRILQKYTFLFVLGPHLAILRAYSVLRDHSWWNQGWLEFQGLPHARKTPSPTINCPGSPNIHILESPHGKYNGQNGIKNPVHSYLSAKIILMINLCGANKTAKKVDGSGHNTSS